MCCDCPSVWMLSSVLDNKFCGMVDSVQCVHPFLATGGDIFLERQCETLCRPKVLHFQCNKTGFIPGSDSPKGRLGL